MKIKQKEAGIGPFKKTVLPMCFESNLSQLIAMGSGRGSVGGAVTSSTRDSWFKSSHWQFLFTYYLLYLICV